MQKKVIIFDMDGVLFDTIPYARKVFLERHPGVTEEMYNQIHSGNFHIEASKYSHLKIVETEEEKIKHQIDYAEKKSKTKMFGGIKELLDYLKNSGYLLVLNTNAYNKNCLPMLEYAGIKNLFDFIATAEISKDKIEKFKLIEDKYKIEKKDVLFITDALGDVKDASVAEIPTVAVTWGGHDRSFFERERHTNLIGIVDTIEELKKFIEEY
jgi:phosphoglycolate phosphatase-like HAD superfamily hydrolase